MSYKYDEYLGEHFDNVEAAYDWLQENLPELLTLEYDLDWQICYGHDQSKRSLDEYSAYDDYFYGEKKTEAIDQAFDLAWLHHIHHNPHHWQYWILHLDDPTKAVTVVEMPYNYIIEMICDWWSFSFAKDDLTLIFAWYEENKPHIMFHEKTRKIVEDILGKIKTKLEE